MKRCFSPLERAVRGEVDVFCSCLPGISFIDSEEISRASMWGMSRHHAWLHYPLVVARVACRNCVFQVITRAQMNVAWEPKQGTRTRRPPNFSPNLLDRNISCSHFFFFMSDGQLVIISCSSTKKNDLTTTFTEVWMWFEAWPVVEFWCQI